MNDDDDDDRDLRARNKQATREAIGRAALRLAIERGPHGLALVRVHDIATAAGVSPRTYNNYFSSREEAICAFQADQSRRAGRALRSRPAGEPLDQAVTAAVIGLYTDSEPDKAGLRMIMMTPELEGEALKAFSMAEGPLAEAIAARTGTDLARDVYPAVMAAAVTGAVRVAGRHWLAPGNTESFAAVLRRTLSCVFSTQPPEPPMPPEPPEPPVPPAPSVPPVPPVPRGISERQERNSGK
ncbi:TetR/AcrR family transcriptional regulator [Microbispora rosea]|uniref:TetR/AcrR family transcriptional regulator n=1 Tax=Microbispora rosea TaxID=58117 RepID=UPI003D8FEB1B